MESGPSNTEQPSAPDTPQAEAARLQRERDQLRERELQRAREDARAAFSREPAQDAEHSGPGRPVDHERTPGVPPPDVDDYDELVDKEGAESFPASDPPSHY
jgi:hypothetical protein